MKTRAKFFLLFFVIFFTLSVYLWYAGKVASAELFLGGLPYVIGVYFTGILAALFFGLTAVNLIKKSASSRESRRDVSIFTALFGLVLFGVSYFPLRWFADYGAGVPSTLWFFGVFFMIAGIIGIINRNNGAPSR